MAQPPHSEVVDHMLELGGREFRRQIGECSTCIQHCVINRHVPFDVFHKIVHCGEETKYMLSRTIVVVLWRENRFDWIRDVMDKLDLSHMHDDENQLLEQIRAGGDITKLYPYKRVI